MKYKHVRSAHHRLYNGRLFSAAHDIQDLGSGSSYRLLFRTSESMPPNRVELIQYEIVAVEQPVTAVFYEAPTVSSEGIAVSVVCRNRQDPRAANVQIYHGTSVSDNGVIIGLNRITGVKHGGGGDQNVGGWLLKSNTDYLVVITNNHNNTNDIIMSATWSEAT